MLGFEDVAGLNLFVLSMSTYFNGREIFLIDGLPESTSRNSVETTGTGTGKS